MGLLQLSLPVIVILAFIAFKLKHSQKKVFFKIPLIASSTALSIVIGHMARGVMGFYGAAFCDLLLYPALLAMKKLHQAKEKRLVASGKHLALAA